MMRETLAMQNGALTNDEDLWNAYPVLRCGQGDDGDPIFAELA